MDKIIFGTGEVGKALLKQCNKSGIKIYGFCSNEKKKKVMSVAQAKKLKLGFLIATGDVKFVNAQLKGCNIFNYQTAKLLRKIDLKKYKKSVQFAILNCIDANLNYKNKYFLRSLDVMITERCTLRCKDCSNLMSYFKHPKDIDVKQLLKEIIVLLRTYKIGEFRVLGGEPFLNEDWEIIVKALLKNRKVKRIVILTNGTIIPKIYCLRSTKILVLITDYGKLSPKLNILTDLFYRNNISYEVLSPNWTDCGKIRKHNYPKTQLEKIYLKCCARNPTLSNGKLYDCAFSANLARLGIYDNKASCDYCNGRPLGDKTIKPARQKNAEPKGKK